MTSQTTSTPAKVSLLSVEDSLKAAEAAGVPAALAQLNIFRALLHRPAVAKAVNDLLLALLFKGELDARLREFVIMRIGWATGCDYEWTQHWTIALERFGCTQTELLALRDWRSADCFDPAARAVLAATDDMLETGRVSDATWRECVEALPSEGDCLELLAAIGTWRLISQLARSIDLGLEEGVASWPPDGLDPNAST
jgi:alkylhydroperoxidase family enzyme